jgi:hypothetical protein
MRERRDNKGSVMVKVRSRGINNGEMVDEENENTRYWSR